MALQELVIKVLNQSDLNPIVIEFNSGETTLAMVREMLDEPRAFTFCLKRDATYLSVPKMGEKTRILFGTEDLYIKFLDEVEYA
mgnify:CR=1 FL=1